MKTCKYWYFQKKKNSKEKIKWNRMTGTINRVRNETKQHE